MTIFQTPPLTIVDHPADAAHCGGARYTPKYIVLHATGGTNSLDWLTTTSPPSNPVSVHRLISKTGVIYKLVPDTVNAWGAGYGAIGPIGPNSPINLNAVALQIELENLDDGKDPYPQPQLNSAADQIIEWWGRYGFLPVLGHMDVDTRKTDPAGFDWVAFYQVLKTKLALVLGSQIKV